jgi:hypothetical protein
VYAGMNSLPPTHIQLPLALRPTSGGVTRARFYGRGEEVITVAVARTYAREVVVITTSTYWYCVYTQTAGSAQVQDVIRSLSSGCASHNIAKVHL